jgi:hypothetical protein
MATKTATHQPTAAEAMRSGGGHETFRRFLSSLTTRSRAMLHAPGRSPGNVLAAFRDASRAHGIQLDDQSALVLRILKT